MVKFYELGEAVIPGRYLGANMPIPGAPPFRLI